MSHYIIGLTGGIGSGKTTIANIFASYHVDVIDADVIAREVVQAGSSALEAIAQHFGKNFILANGELNRALLREKIFSHEADKQWLNNLLHPLIRTSLISQLNAAKSDYCLLVAPLLVENNLLSLVDRVLVIDITEEEQIKRTSKRDNNSPEQVKAIIKSQTARNIRLSHADDVIDNSEHSLTNVQKNVAELHQKYLSLAALK